MTRTHLYHYHFEGRTYLFEMPAESKEEADARVAVVSSRARYDGELVMKIPAGVPGAGLFVRLCCAIRNFFGAR